MNAIAELLKEAEEFDHNMFPLRDDLKKDEVVCGELEPIELKLWALTLYYEREAQVLKVMQRFEHSEDGLPNGHADRHRLESRAEMCGRLLWYSIRSRIPNAYDCTRFLGIRRPNLIVWRQETVGDRGGIAGILGEMFGGGLHEI